MAQLRISRRASVEIRRANGWWKENREKNPGLFRAELEHALKLLEHTPRAGIARKSEGHPELRRLVLRRCRYHLYYAVVDDGAFVDVLSCWHAERGHEPNLG